MSGRQLYTVCYKLFIRGLHFSDLSSLKCSILQLFIQSLTPFVNIAPWANFTRVLDKDLSQGLKSKILVLPWFGT